jgi:serine/threonine protein kinase
MAPNFLLLTEQAIDSAKSLTSGENEQLFKLKKRQCKYVAQKLSKSREVLQVLKSAVGESIVCNCEAALKELYRVATDALSLIKDCRREPWLKAAITKRSSEDFAEVCYDLQWCTSILCSISFQGTTRATYSQIDISQPEGCDGRLGAFDLFRLETAAKQDQEDLRSNLELHVCDASCVRSPAEPCLAAHVLRRLDNRPSALGADPMTRNSPSSLWQVDPQGLPEGKRLGGGAFGDVYQTEWLGESYAKKVFREASGNSFKVEAEILADLCHPHVVRTVCWSQLLQKKRDYSLVMDLMEEDLSDFLHPTLDDSDDDSNDVAAVPLSTDAAVDLMLQTARGLRYLHSKSIVHRDVKSKNILVKPLIDVPELEYKEGYLTVKLADFGTSRIKNSITRRSHQTSNIGTTCWMAPEVFHIQEEWMYTGAAQSSPIAYPHKADVWSFAMVCFEILTRKVPFEGELRTGLFHRITVDGLRPVLPEECPRRLVSLIQKCWEYDPCERPDFLEICNELQYIKGLLLTGSQLTSLLSREPKVSLPVLGGYVHFNIPVGYWYYVFFQLRNWVIRLVLKKFFKYRWVYMFWGCPMSKYE